jgi:hypothetical protein
MTKFKIITAEGYQNELDSPKKENGRYIEIRCPHHSEGPLGDKMCSEDMRQGNRELTDLWNSTCNIRV